MSGYFNLELQPDQTPTKPRHTLNHPYKGSQPFELHAPDADGTLIVHAKSEAEARDHMTNAFFDFLFRGARVGASIRNPACPFCAANTQRGGRNSSGTRAWKCQNPECRRSFVLDRAWRGGVNHPTQSKKPEFCRLYLAGMPIDEAAERLRLSKSTAGNWAEQVAANNPEAMAGLTCPCGRNIRHRGSCSYRLAKHLKGKILNERAQAAS